MTMSMQNLFGDLLLEQKYQRQIQQGEVHKTEKIKRHQSKEKLKNNCNISDFVQAL